MDNIVNVSVDAGKIVGNFKHTWNYIGYDECNFTTSPGGRALLGKFGALGDAPFFVRPHHLLCTGNTIGEYKWGSTNVYTEDADGNPVYDFTTLDSICDTLIESGNKPFFEVGFMPRDLADTRMAADGKSYKIVPRQSARDYQHVGFAMPPKDYQKWHDLIFAIVDHFVKRHGAGEVESWYFEMWNEPQIGNPYWKGSYDEFFKLYDYTEAAIHKALPGGRFGGPAVSKTQEPDGPGAVMMDVFLNHCKNGVNYVTGETGARLDFITWHVKGKPGGYGFTTHFVKEVPSVKIIVEQSRNIISFVKKYGYQDKEVVLSEADPDGWAAGGRFDNPNLNFRNTEYYASYVASGYKNTYDLAEREDMDIRPLAWAFMFDNERCFEGTRTFSTQGIDKAVFNLFKLYSRLGTRRLALKSSMDVDPLVFKGSGGPGECEIDGWATAKPDGSVQVLLYCHHDDFDEGRVFDVALDVKGLGGESVKLTHYRIDAEHSNAYAEWVRQGKPDYPAGAQYEAIKSRDGLELCEPQKTVALNAGALSHTFKLPTHGISLIQIDKSM